MRYWLLIVLLGAAAIGGTLLRAQRTPTPAAAQVPGTDARQAIEAAAAALGGIDRIRAVKNLTLIGYAQYAYQNGGGNISPLPGAPQKYIAANDYRRIYDLEHGRMLHQERRNDLFPFAAYGGHDFALQRQGLDGDIAYNVNAQGQAARGGDARDRRMWMHANPVVAIRAALDPANTLGSRRQEQGLTLVEVKLKEGDLLTIGIRPPSNLPAFVRWIGPQVNLSEVIYTTSFYGFENFSGLELPMGYTTRFDWRPEVEQVKIYVDNYLVDSQIDDLVAPSPGATAQGGRGGRAGGAGGRGGAGAPIEVTPMARGVWRITGGTMVIEFADHMMLFEVDGQPARIKQVIEAARKIVPNKPVTQVIVSHHHFDHSSGLREAVAEGLTVISRRDNGVIFQEMTERPAPNFPDDLAKSGRKMTFIPVDDHLQFKDAAMTVELYHVIANNHMADALFAYVPEHKMIIEGDIATAAEDLQWWGDSWLDNIAYRKLEVERNVPVHMTPMTKDEVVRMVNGGIQRVKQFCNDHVAKGDYFPGCPAQVR
jgi:glyoxylase-like metal-dependent hydrolase (beta-lactamase superfamily II)